MNVVQSGPARKHLGARRDCGTPRTRLGHRAPSTEKRGGGNASGNTKAREGGIRRVGVADEVRGEERVEDARIAGRKDLCVQPTDEAAGVVRHHRPQAVRTP